MFTGPADDALAPLAPLLRAGGPVRADMLRRCAFADAGLGGTAARHFELLADLPVDALLDAASAADALELRQWGGAMADGDGPVGHRHVAYSVTIDGPDAIAPLRPHVTGGTFLNFLHDQARTDDAYTARDLRALRSVKQAWDPENVLGRTHNIAPEAAARAVAA